MTEQGQAVSVYLNTVSPSLHPIIQHLCEGDCHAFGSVLQWCETRGDCVYAVVCPGCSERFLIEEDALSELERWTEANGGVLVCGVQL
jgi:hypothetical protein